MTAAGGAGRSAAQKAAAVRAEPLPGGVWRRALRLLGVDPAAASREAEAARWDAGARGEEMTAAVLAPLGAEGWAGFYDWALPGTGANVDHVLVPPAGDLVALVDSKLWSPRRGVVRRTAAGGLRHGGQDRQGSVRALVFEARVLRGLLGVDVVPVMCVHGARVAGGRFVAGERVLVVEAGQVCGLLRQYAGSPDPVAFGRLVGRADAVLPRYVEGGGPR